MPRVLKFSCHNCGAKLAVPLHMSGMSDHCPKCGALVTSPALPPKEARASAPLRKESASGTYSAEQLAEALRPPPAAPSSAGSAPPREAGEKPPAPRPGKPPSRGRKTDAEESAAPRPAAPSPQPSLFADPVLPEEPVVPVSRPSFPDAPVVKTPPELFRPQETVPAEDPIVPPPSAPLEGVPDGPRSPRARNTKTRPQLHAVSRRPPAPEEDPILMEPGVPPDASLPHQAPDSGTASEVARPGVGEVLAPGPAFGPLSLPPADARPRLNVPLVQVGSSPRRERRMRWNRMALLGVAAFLFVDLLVVLWIFRKPIGLWWKGPPRSSSVVSSAPPVPPAAEPAPAGSPTGTSAPGSMSDTPTIAAPSDFLEADTAPVRPSPPAPAEEPPVPMAIPVTELPSEPSASVSPAPPLTPVVEPAPEPAPVLTSTPSSVAPPPAEVSSSAPSLSAASVIEPVMEGGLLPVPSMAASPGPGTPSAPPDSPAPSAASSSSASLTVTPQLSLPPLRENVPEAPTDAVPYGGLPPPPADMAPPNGPVVPSSPAVTLVTTAPRIGKVPKEAQSALEALQKFLDAPTWKERLLFVQKADALKSAMEKHAARFGDGPIRVGKIDFVERYVNRDRVPPYCMFEIDGGSLSQPVLALVEQSTKNGVKVDWEAFVDFKDNLLLKFLEDRRSSPQKFRVMIRRKHYFDKDVPDLSSKDTFEVKQPQGHFQGAIFAAKSSSIGRQLANQLGWGMDMPVIAELAWRTDGKNHWVEIVSIASYGWRG